MFPAPTNCKQCGAVLKPDAKFCPSCGTTVTEPRPAAGACLQCQHANPPGSRFCRSCGAALPTVPRAGLIHEAAPTEPLAVPPIHPTEPLAVPPVYPTALPPRPVARSRTWLPVAAALGALVIVVGAAAAVIAVVNGNGSHPASARHVTQGTVSSQASVATAPSSSPPPAAASASPYNEGDFAAAPPPGWTRVENGRPRSTYVESKWHSPGNPSDFVLIDMSLGALPPAQAAAPVRAALQKQAGYHELSFGPGDLTQASSTKWIFQQSSSERVDYFFSQCGHDFAVLGSTTPSAFGQMLPTFTQFADSVRATCAR